MVEVSDNGQADERFQHLLALARDGNEDAIGDLFREFGFKYVGDEE